MFSKEFFPTPKHVIEMMITGLDMVGKKVLEPSSGSGHIIDTLKEHGAEVWACESNLELAHISMKKADYFLSYDFFNVTAEEVSHLDFMIMNPPFSNADKHIKHAWDIAPDGCNIIALCNAETVKNRYSSGRTVLGETIEKYGHWSNIGDVFSTAERTTNIDVALVKMFKPKSGESEFEDYFFDMNEEQEDVVSGSGIMKHNDVRETVNRYVAAVKMFDNVIESSTAINKMISPIANGLGISFGAHQTYTSSGVQHASITRDVFKKELQKSAWRSIFEKMNMGKYVTSGVMADINKFVEQQQHIPFTMSNIYKMLEIIFGTHGSRMDKVLVEAFDHICSLSADNSEAGEKWKTNSSYKINRRFIRGYTCDYDSRWPTQHVRTSYSSASRLDDIVKALCHLTGKNYDDVCMKETDKIDSYGKKIKERNDLGAFFSRNQTNWGEWVQWNDFFRVRGYKKGTMHFEFVDEKVWMEFNRRVAKIKGWVLPQKTDKKSKGTERTKKAGVEVYSN